VANITLYRIPNADLSNQSISTILDGEPSAEIPLIRDISARLFIFRDPEEVPDWANYLSPIATSPLGISKREPTGTVLLIKPDGRTRVVYAATWGIGRFYLQSSRFEPDWGLRCALNLISGDKTGDGTWDPARVRALRSKRMSQNTLVAEIQSSRKTTIDSFPFIFDVDQLRRVTGAPTNSDRFGSTISGGVSIHVKRPDNPKGLINLCQDIERVHRSTNYQRHFGWIDNVSPITDQATILNVYDQIASALRNEELAAINLSPPTVVQWETVSKFSYQWGHKSKKIDELSIETFREFLVQNDLLRALSSEGLRDQPKLHALDDVKNRIQSWPIGRCLSGEFRIGSDPYILDDGSIFFVSKDYLDELNIFTNSVRTPTVPFPAMTDKEKEDSYNKRISASLRRAILLDKKTVRRHQATAIEVCDVATANRQLIHVKIGTSSSSLSHLFAQGVVSAELLHMDPDFRKEVSRLLSAKGTRKIKGSGSAQMQDFRWLHSDRFEPHACEVIYVIMTERPSGMRKDKLPFFSKVNLRMRCNELRRMGYIYSLALVHL
jgi:uncharacterized protein (TIGR04141 family)